jgi:hypothetical protein
VLCGTHQHKPTKCFSLICQPSSVPRLDESNQNTQGTSPLRKERHAICPVHLIIHASFCHCNTMASRAALWCRSIWLRVKTRLRPVRSAILIIRLTFIETCACNFAMTPCLSSNTADYNTICTATGCGPFRGPLMLCCATCQHGKGITRIETSKQKTTAKL